MNKARRKILAKINEKLEQLKEELQLDVIDVEQEAFDNMPESLQYSEKGDRMEDIISTLLDAVSNIEEAIDCITEAQE